jgi:hypothetical protein
MKKLELLFFFLHGMSGLKNINHSPEGDGCRVAQNACREVQGVETHICDFQFSKMLPG